VLCFCFVWLRYVSCVYNVSSFSIIHFWLPRRYSLTFIRLLHSITYITCMDSILLYYRHTALKRYTLPLSPIYVNHSNIHHLQLHYALKFSSVICSTFILVILFKILITFKFKQVRLFFMVIRGLFLKAMSCHYISARYEISIYKYDLFMKEKTYNRHNKYL
jgi:hypothetical protein